MLKGSTISDKEQNPRFHSSDHKTGEVYYKTCTNAETRVPDEKKLSGSFSYGTDKIIRFLLYDRVPSKKLGHYIRTLAVFRIFRPL
jgi:hypothetical protein